MSNTPIALQLFSVRGEVAKGLAPALKTVADLGYQGAEPWGYDGKTLVWQGHSAAEIRKMYDDNGLKCCGIHLATDALRHDNLQRTIEFNQILGNKFLIVAWDKPRMSTCDGIADLAAILNGVAEKLKPLGMYCGYHCHGFDFDKVDGLIAWDVLFGATQKDVVMQLDIGNCASGGGDPIATLKKFPGRARSVHLKDFGGPKGSVIGEGKMDWKTIFELCRTLHQPEWYVIEEGGEGGIGYEVSGRSLKAVKAMGV